MSPWCPCDLCSVLLQLRFGLTSSGHAIHALYVPQGWAHSPYHSFAFVLCFCVVSIAINLDDTALSLQCVCLGSEVSTLYGCTTVGPGILSGDLTAPLLHFMMKNHQGCHAHSWKRNPATFSFPVFGSQVTLVHPCVCFRDYPFHYFSEDRIFSTVKGRIAFPSS